MASRYNKSYDSESSLSSTAESKPNKPFSSKSIVRSKPENQGNTTCMMKKLTDMKKSNLDSKKAEILIPGNSYGSGKPFGLGTLPQSQKTSFSNVPNSDPRLIQEISDLINKLKEKDNAFDQFRQKTNAQLEHMKAFLRTRFPDFPGTRGSGTGTGEESGSETVGEGSGIAGEDPRM
ncbi:unnamed protein product [Cochlearia groenlandica]